MTGVALYGRTYLDAEVEIPLDVLATGKGKVDAEVRAVLGGFPCNAARALAGRLRGEDLTIVTRIAAIDVPRLRAAAPPGARIEAIDTGSLDWPPITVIVNPASDCKLLRSGRPGDLCADDLRAIPAAALHVFGRVDRGLVGAVRRAAPDAVLAWCAGAGDRDAIDACDLACFNTAEARALVGDGPGGERQAAAGHDRHAPRSASPVDARSTRELACVLAERARRPAVRVVTGRGGAPTAAAVRRGDHVHCVEATPAPVAQPRRLKGAGDVFAAHFVVEAALDDHGAPRPALELERALALAQRAVAAFMSQP